MNNELDPLGLGHTDLEETGCGVRTDEHRETVEVEHWIGLR